MRGYLTAVLTVIESGLDIPLTSYSQISLDQKYIPFFPFPSVAPAPLHERQLQVKELEYAQQPGLGTIESVVCSQHCGAQSHFIAQCVLGIPLHQYSSPSLMLFYFPLSATVAGAPHSPAAGSYNSLLSKARLSPFARDPKASAAILNRR